jgi:hypothetical protein
MVLGVGFMGILTLGAIGVGVSELLAGDHEPAMFLIAGGIYLGTGTAIVLSMLLPRRRLSARSVSRETTGSGHDGIAIFYSARLYFLIATIMFATFVLTAAYALGGMLEWEMRHFDPATNVVDIILFGALAVICLWFFIGVVSGRLVGGRARLVLSPDGIYHRSYTFEHFVPWRTVFAVSAEEFRGPLIVARTFESKEIRTRRTIWARLQDESGYLPDLMVRGRQLAVDPAVAYHALRYYYAHPEARAELLTPDGEQRIRSGSLLD